MKQIVMIKDDKGRVNVFDTFADLIDYANTCGSMGFLPDGFAWKILTIDKESDPKEDKA